MCLEKFVAAAGESVFVHSPQVFESPQEIDLTVEDFVSGLVQYLFNECAHTKGCGSDGGYDRSDTKGGKLEAMGREMAESGGCWKDGGVTLCAGFGSISNVGRVAATRFFESAVYTPKVMQQMSVADDLYHAFPTTVDALATQAGRVTTIVGKDGATYLRLQADGMVNGVRGVFDYIKNTAGEINHRLFIPKP